MALSEWAKMYGTLQWIAGFFDGEGTIGAYGKGLTISISQKDRELLDRLQALFGGSIYLRKHKRFPIWVWQIHQARNVAGLAMTLYPLLSQKRQSEIHKALMIWKGRTWPMLTCKHGHPWTPDSTYHYTLKDGSKIRKCRLCHIANEKRRWRAAHPVPRYRKPLEEPMIYPPLRFQRRRYGYINYTWAYATIDGQEYQLGDPYKGLHWSKRALREALTALYAQLATALP